ncbi:hypothetical protein KR093_008452 [Drosophila rubida]|uniref:Protein THEM6 n=1 Tax=Drosophila rubida TaxID=30044 RepID=A0AAD4PMT2_9MUSC|nr:hypothetical protein KR093_008452 [Drosophila rubida]
METSLGYSAALLLLILYILLDVNYFIRCAFVYFTARVLQARHRLTDTTTIVGLCTPQDVDIFLRHMNNARFLRELNFASLHYYAVTDLYNRVRQRGGTVVQGAVSLRYRRFIPIFHPYKILTKLVWWDERAIYLEQQFVSLINDFVNAVVLSKHSIIHCNMVELLKSWPETMDRPDVMPDDLKLWLQAIEASSHKLNPDH